MRRPQRPRRGLRVGRAPPTETSELRLNVVLAAMHDQDLDGVLSVLTSAAMTTVVNMAPDPGSAVQAWRVWAEALLSDRMLADVAANTERSLAERGGEDEDD